MAYETELAALLEHIEAHLDQPLLQIALAAGYETQPSFTRAFRKAYGLNPQAYRRRGSFTPVQPPFLVPRAKITQLFTPKGVAA